MFVQASGGCACRLEFFEQVFPAAPAASCLNGPGILIETGKGRSVLTGEGESPVSKNPLGIDDMLQHFPDCPFPFGVSKIEFFARDTFYEFAELFGVFADGLAKVFFFDQIDIALVELGGDDL